MSTIFLRSPLQAGRTLIRTVIAASRSRGLPAIVVTATLLTSRPISGSHPGASYEVQDKQDCLLSAAQEQLLLGATYHDFDQSMGEASWRSLLNRGCPATASAVIAKYITAHRGLLAAEELRLLHFHQGQTIALAGRHKDAITPLRESLAGQPPKEWIAYVEATIGFLDSDFASLRAARDSYVAVSSPGSARLRVIDGLIACFEKRYAEAWMCLAK